MTITAHTAALSETYSAYQRAFRAICDTPARTPEREAALDLEDKAEREWIKAKEAARRDLGRAAGKVIREARKAVEMPAR